MNKLYFNEELNANTINEDSKDNPFYSVLNLTQDEDYRDEGSTKNRRRSKSRLNDLDINRISDRLIVSGMFWNNRTERMSFRNNIEQAAEFLKQKYSHYFMVYNLAASSSSYDTSIFDHQVVQFKFSKSLALTIKNIFDVCRSMAAWLLLNEKNVAVIHCTNGRFRTGLITACFLKFCDLFYNSNDAFDYFLKRRCANDSSWVTITMRRYLRYFNDIIILNGRVPNNSPLQLHQIIINTIPNFDGMGSCNPGIEVFENGRLIYSSLIGVGDSAKEDCKGSDDEDFNSLLTDYRKSHMFLDAKDRKESNALALKDNYHIVFRLEKLFMARDIQIRIFHRNESVQKNITILNIVFNTGFLTPGVIRLKLSDLDVPMKEPNVEDKRFGSEFSMDLIITECELIDKIEYDNSKETSNAKNFIKLSQYHCLRPDPQLLKVLELQGYRKVIGRLALQLRNNDIHLSHEFIEKLKSSKFFDILENELTILGKIKYENIISQNCPVVPLKRDSITTMIPESGSAVPQIGSLSLTSFPEESLSKINEFADSPSKEANFHSSPSQAQQSNADDLSSNPLVPPPPPPPFGFAGGPPPPPPPPGTIKPTVELRTKIVKNPLHWNEIPRLNDLSNTVWKDIVEEKEKFTLDLHRFEELFCFNPMAEAKAEPDRKSTVLSGKINLIDVRRANNVGIGLSRFYKRFTETELLEAIVSQSPLLSVDDLNALLALLPTDEEKQLLSLYRGNHSDLDKVEKFMLVMMKENNIRWMCESLIFQCLFFQDLGFVSKQLQDLTGMMVKIRENAQLKLLLSLVLEIGNLANYDYGRNAAGRMKGKALGFKLDSLIKLQDVKSVDKKSTLMNYLAMISEENDPSIIEITKDLYDLGILRHYDTTSLLDTFNRLMKGLDKLKNEGNELSDSKSRIDEFRSRQIPFIKEASKALLLVSEEVKTMKESWEQTASYFGENPEERKIEELFLLLDQFLKYFKQSFLENRKLEGMNLRKEPLKSGNDSRKKKAMSMMILDDDSRSESSENTLALCDSKLSLSLSFDSDTNKDAS